MPPIADQPDQPSSARRRNLALAMSTAFCIGVTLGLFPALIAINVESRGFDASWNGLLGGMPALAGIMAGPFAPRLIARLGTVPAYLTVTGIAIVAASLFPLISDLGAWFVIRFVMGIGMGIQWVVSEAWVNRLAAGPRRGLILSIYVIVLSLGLSTGPAVMNLVGTRGAAPFLTASGILLLSCLPLPFAADNAPREAGAARSLPLLAAFMRKPSAMLVGLGDGFVFQSLMVFVPIYFLRLGSGEAEALHFLTIFFVGGLILQLVVGYALDRTSAETMIVVCAILMILSLTVLAAAFPALVAVSALLVVMGGASAAFYTAGLAGISDSFSAEEMPSGTATFTMLWYVGGLTGPAAVGYAMTLWNPHGMAVAISIACAILGLVNLLGRRTARA